jgi:hypothetical protein
MHTITLFFCSSVGLLGRDILGPIEGSTPLRASSSKSRRSTNLSPYVKALNFIVNARQPAASGLEAMIEDRRTDLPRVLRSLAKLRPNMSGLACHPIDPSASSVLCLGRHLKVVIHQWRGLLCVPRATHGAGQRQRDDAHGQPGFWYHRHDVAFPEGSPEMIHGWKAGVRILCPRNARILIGAMVNAHAHTHTRRALGPADNASSRRRAVRAHAQGSQRSAMNSPPELASPASSSTESLTDDVAMTQEYSSSAVHEKPERSGFLANSLAFAKNVAKRRLPGASKTTSNRDPKARRREEGSQKQRGTSDRRDPTKAKDDLLDVALFESLKKSMATFRSFDGVLLSLSRTFHRDRRPS